MPRHRFGGGVADYVVFRDENGALQLAANRPVAFWDAATAGDRYESLSDQTGTEVAAILSDGTGAIPEFDGPEDVRALWADASDDLKSGPRRLIIATDLAADLATVLQQIGQLQTTAEQQQTMLGTAVYGLLYDAGAAAYPPVPLAVAGRRLLWIGPAVPAAARPGDLHIKTFE